MVHAHIALFLLNPIDSQSDLQIYLSAARIVSQSTIPKANRQLLCPRTSVLDLYISHQISDVRKVTIKGILNVDTASRNTFSRALFHGIVVTGNP